MSTAARIHKSPGIELDGPYYSHRTRRLRRLLSKVWHWIAR